ncbi:NAD(P)-dependent oxidoreductase [Kribbella qitaiheensis]|uniref:NAD(P)-dependent oxidoreductase n=1 Tax=Kribbella qitaiheensis TaxID=1544730 RepID=A0A7G6WVQ9_9ACTN|nr:NAD(P)-dependent oxidoreductase [Kribbella qitaiheensis]QNE18074.1 NAD(P)-dependent oxidoreductase [Kribbella qitaiheensis]
MDENSKIAFLGLGSMGGPMARRVAQAGYPLTVWNRSPGRADGFTEVAASPADAVRDADVVVTMLADPTAVLEVVRSFAADLKQGAILVEASTIGPAAVREVADLLPEGVTLVDSPVMGSVDRAASGELSLFVGGDADDVMPLLELFGSVNRTGAVGTGAALKLVMINTVVEGVALIGEAFALADKLGLPEEQVKQAMAASPLAGIAGRAFAEGAYFPIRLAAKDVALAADAADLPIARAIHTRLTSYEEAANEDIGQILKYFRT